MKRSLYDAKAVSHGKYNKTSLYSGFLDFSYSFLILYNIIQKSSMVLPN